MTTKKELEKQIRDLKNKMLLLGNINVISSTQIGADLAYTIKQVTTAKNDAEHRAGLVKNTGDGSVWEEDDVVDVRIPITSIHQFDNITVCECACHNKNKLDCILCYDHPVHLNTKRGMKHSKT